MDSLTQVLLGSVVGYAVSGKSFGKKAFLYGAIIATIPDLDFIPIIPLMDNEFTYLKYHRGLSHSLAGLSVATLFTWMICKWKFPKYKTALTYLVFWALATHILLDCFTSWGTQVFWPFDQRVAWNSIFIVDPIYTLFLFLPLVIALFLKSSKKIQKMMISGLFLSSLYLLLAVGIKMKLNQQFEKIYQSHHLDVLKYTTRPSPFNILLWTSTAELEDQYCFSMSSLLDSRLDTRVFYIKKNHHLLKGFLNEDVRELLAYTKGYFSVEKIEDGIIIHDLRYGLMGDPHLNKQQFVFSYELRKNENQGIDLKVINPRPKNSRQLIKQLWDRLKGDIP